MNRIYVQPLLFLLSAIVLAGLAAVVIFARPLVDAIVIAGLLGYLLDPLVVVCQRFTPLSREWSARVVFIGAILVLAGLATLLGTLAINAWPAFQEELWRAWEEAGTWFNDPLELWGFSFDAQPMWMEFIRSITNAWNTLPHPSLEWIQSITSNLLWSAVVVVSLYYFLVDGTQIKPMAIGLVPQRYQQEASFLLNEIDDVWGVFLRMQLLIFAILTVLVLFSSGLILWLFRAGWLPLSPVGVGILLAVVYGGIQQIDNFWLRPQWLGKTLNLHPGLVFVGLISALVLSGVLGALLIVPFLATLKLIGRYIHAKLIGLPIYIPPQPPLEDVEPQPQPLPTHKRRFRYQFAKRVRLVRRQLTQLTTAVSTSSDS